MALATRLCRHGTGSARGEDMTGATNCEHCGNSFPMSRSICPHCARPALYPNVRAAEMREEVEALRERYAQAKEAAQLRGCPANVGAFEEAAGAAKAATARSLVDVQRLAHSDRELYATYYQLADAGVRIPADEKWDVFRTAANASWFPSYFEDLRFAALTLDGTGLSSYGECTIVWREDMIAHRASVTEENTTTFMLRRSIPFGAMDRIPTGYRATWARRGVLCVAKLADRITENTQAKEHQGILLAKGATTEEDDFVEAQIWGSMSHRTMESVIVPRPARRAERVILKDLREKLDKVGVELKEV